MKSKYIRTFMMYNIGFFGTFREKADASGHFNIALDTENRKFAVIEGFEYGGFMNVGETKKLKPLTKNDVRYFHDAIFKRNKSCEKFEQKEAIEIDDSIKWHKLYNHYIGANIYLGDRIVDLRDGKTVKVPYEWDLMLVNRNFHYKHADEKRAKLHPAPMTRIEFLEKLAKIDPFESWSDDVLPKDKKLDCTLKVEDKLYSFYEDKKDDRKLYVETFEGRIFSKHDLTSGSKYDVHRKLSGEILSKYEDGIPYHYSVFNCKSHSPSLSEWMKEPKGFIDYRLFKDEVSYYYNTAETYL